MVKIILQSSNQFELWEAAKRIRGYPSFYIISEGQTDDAIQTDGTYLFTRSVDVRVAHRKPYISASDLARKIWKDLMGTDTDEEAELILINLIKRERKGQANQANTVGEDNNVHTFII